MTLDLSQSPSATPPYLPKCRNNLCDRQTSAFYCCGPCGDAAEATPVYEIHAHATSCDARFEERGPWR